MEMDDKDIEQQKKLKGLWNDAKRYQMIQHEVKQALSQSQEVPQSIRFNRRIYFAIAATIIILIGVTVVMIFFIRKPFPNSGKDIVIHERDTTLKLYMDKPNAKAKQEIFRDEILLQWTNLYDTITHLVILDSPDGKIVFRTEIKPKKQTFLLPKSKLKPGKYKWYIGDKKLKRNLVIEH